MKVLHCKESDENSPNLSFIDQLCNFFKMIFDLQDQFSKFTATNFQLHSNERLSFLFKQELDDLQITEQEMFKGRK